MNWIRYRSFFPITERVAFFDQVGGGPISSRVEEALVRHARNASRRWVGGGNPELAEALMGPTRRRAAELLAVDPDEVALPRDARDGMYSLLRGLEWKPGDAIVLHGMRREALPGATELLARGVEIRPLAPPGRPFSRPALERALSRSGTRLLLLPSVEPVDGARIDPSGPGALCRERGILFGVDASASLGCLPLRPAQLGVDFLVADGHRQLASLPGCGLLYVAAFLHDALRASPLRAPECGPGARRLDGSVPGSAASVALGAALDLLLETGVDRIAQRVLELAARLSEGLARRNVPVSSPRDARRSSGAVHFSLPDTPPTSVQRRLRQQRIHIAVTETGLRACPSAYNDENEIDALIRAL